MTCKAMWMVGGLLAVMFAAVAPACAKTTFEAGSKTFANGGTIPLDNTYNGLGCSGKNISPEVHWSGAPAGTKAFAITVFDPDAGDGQGWWHWAAYKIDASVRAIPAGGPVPGTELPNGFGTKGYGGPCPPPGDTPHHYVFTVYAIDANLTEVADGPDLVNALKGHTLAKAQFIGRFGR